MVILTQEEKTDTFPSATLTRSDELTRLIAFRSKIKNSAAPAASTKALKISNALKSCDFLTKSINKRPQGLTNGVNSELHRQTRVFVNVKQDVEGNVEDNVKKNKSINTLKGGGQAASCAEDTGERPLAMPPDDLTDYRLALQGLALPLAYVDLNKLDANIAALMRQTNGLPVRIASKSIRSVAMLRYLLAKTDKLQGVMCFHPQEAAFLAEQGLDDLLVAYPSMQKAAIVSLIPWLKKERRVVLMVDTLEHVMLLDAIGQASSVCFSVCMDIDVSMSLPGLHFGVHRSPINTVDKALSLYQHIKHKHGVKLVGIMGYEAQIAGLGDRVPRQYVKNLAIRGLKKLSIPRVAKRRQDVATALTQAGAKLTFVNGGGTGSLNSTSQDHSVTEMTIGSGFFCPHLFDYYDHLSLAPAAGFALEVVRQPKPSRVTCSGGGYLASGSADAFRAPIPYLPQGLSLDPNEGAGEVQTPLCFQSSASKRESLTLGDAVFFRHAKAGEICERFATLYGIRNGAIEQYFETYRGAGKGFL
ncbi:amino acid deaminase/aldolase [uncultured Shewanella sp.]|uniref:amino acid deaminase/aldolase n=1 Tax=uncultured Shewanella sp. TaxID=173975 RepID=UPI002603D6C2|nr:amino acid deaminase/aldolase [uncultured Shewanella sp.]